ncbi:hypothetical protein BKA82DRAFT_403534, partial [Pisolithus tinctorius]
MGVSKYGCPSFPFPSLRSTAGLYWHVAMVGRGWLALIWYPLDPASTGIQLHFTLHALRRIHSSRHSISLIAKMPTRRTASSYSTTNMPHTMDSPAAAPTHSLPTTMPALASRLALDITSAKDGCTFSMTKALKGRTSHLLCMHMVECGSHVQNMLRHAHLPRSIWAVRVVWGRWEMDNFKVMIDVEQCPGCCDGPRGWTTTLVGAFPPCACGPNHLHYHRTIGVSLICPAY